MTNYIEYQVKSFKQEDKIIKTRINEDNSMYLIHKTAIQQLQQQRQGNANCKTRSDVRGGGRKPWKQKGTGRARAGSIRSPLWRGGGVIFGPQTKKYQQKINKKEKKIAINNLLYNRQNFITCVKSSFLKLNEPKTKLFIHKIKELNIDPQVKLLIIMQAKYLNTYLATRNLKNIEIISVNQLNLLSIIKSEYILIDNEALDIINTNIL